MSTRHGKKLLVVMLMISFSIWMVSQLKTQIDNFLFNDEGKFHSRLVVVLVACGTKVEESLTLIKSAFMFSVQEQLIKIIVITEGKHVAKLAHHLHELQKLIGNVAEFEIRTLQFPISNGGVWENLFKPCAAQRLFLPTMLDMENSVLYLDTDTLLMSPLSDIWEHFKRFNASQIAALSPEHEDKNIGWYNRFARHPYYGPFGLNSGVMLMNLSRMRDFGWEDRILSYYTLYKNQITWGDQDLINILFHFHPDKIYVLPCEYNYRADHCMYLSLCNASEEIRILHGNRGYFHSRKQPTFRLVYEAFREHRIGTPVKNFITNLKQKLNEEKETSNCGSIFNRLLVHMKPAVLKNNLTRISKEIS